ncbi:hypothetical protein SAMN02745172_01982 [Pseudoxanthobacter soli DSM 19599]|uniref:Uncharacterized protein n=1 Tax=Pseudoxanthobacter soli DSM 19599 TaxID=1123029 RepID=A0A1M7ZJS5_9HYPH|nr:DUF1178 family protein [Pseudoxanthobacter soli]SHO65138.1 hypothetical protein SAMN02745172_01982 [Pseudoxanthobacter soli DSM 19599]
MIHYSLVCSAEHTFDGWFRSSEDFEGQAARGLVSCPACGSTDVRRGLMAPAIATRTERRPADVADAPEPSLGAAAPTAAVAMADPRAAALVEMMRAVRRQVEQTADYVGDRFAEEARKIHYGETDARGIYGEASPSDVKALQEEGVEIHPLPLLPEDAN